MASVNLLELEESGINYGIEGLKILIYGSNSLGKTPQSMKFPKPLLFAGEAGGTAIKGRKVVIDSKKKFVDYVNQLTDEENLDKMKEIYQTIVIDTATDIIELYKRAVALEYGVKDISEMNSNKDMPNGYALYRDAFKRDINKLCAYGYTVIFIMHEELVELVEQAVVTKKNGTTAVGSAGTGVYKIMPKGSNSVKDSARFIKDLCDFRFYIKGNGIDEDGNVIMSTAYCHETDEFYAGSRFDIQNVVNPFTAENLIKAMEDAQRRSAENYDAELVTFELKHDDYTKADYIKDIEPVIKALHPVYPNEVNAIVDKQLHGVKVTDAKESQLVELETIYNNLVALADERNIKY